MEEERTCENCKHVEKKFEEEPCRECFLGFNKWEPMERPRRRTRTTVEQVKRPKPLPMPACSYEKDSSIIPESIRVSFSNGTTVVYTIKVEQPKPQMMEESIEITKWWRKGVPVKERRRRTRTKL